MARSQEKAMSALNRWVDQRRAVESGVTDMGRAPRFPSECRSIKQGESARSQILHQITSMIAQIQNATLGEQRIRDLNDEINRLLRSKFTWESQIRSLGGPDYTVMRSGLGEMDGAEVPGQGGYKYFGVAKELPGVRELLEEQVQTEAPRKSRKDLLRHVDPEYFGWSDENSSSLLDTERSAENIARARINNARRPKTDSDSSGNAALDEGVGLATVFEVASGFTEAQFEELLLKKKKEMLLAMFSRPVAEHAAAESVAHDTQSVTQMTSAEYPHDSHLELVD